MSDGSLILVIEDEKQLAEAVRRGLLAEGFSVDVSHDGQDGLWRATEGTYDAIVMAVPHEAFRKMGVKAIRRLGRRKHVLYDVKHDVTGKHPIKRSHGNA